MNCKLCVLVTGVGGRSVGHQILYALLLLGEKYRVVATDAEAFSFGLYQVNESYIVPRADDPDYIPALLHIIERERVDVVLPGTQPELRVVAENRNILSAAGCIIITSPIEVIRLCSNKERLYNWLDKNGFNVPRTASTFEWRTLVGQVGFPIVVKPAEDSGGSRGVVILKNMAEVESYLDERYSREGVIFQEYVGSEEDEFTVGVMISKTGDLIDSIVLHRKLTGLSLGTKRIIDGRVYILSTGYSQGFVVKHPFIQESCEHLALEMGVRGPLNIQCRLVENKVVVFEAHPRFSGTTSIRADVGFNEPDTLIRNFALAEHFGRLTYQTGVAAIRALQHIIVPIDRMESIPRV